MSKILILSTAADALGDTGKSTGVWFEELATPYYAFSDAGHEVILVTLGGKEIPIDPASDVTGNDAPPSVKRFRDDADAMAALRSPGRLEDEDATRYDAIYIPGGHGAMYDLAESDLVAKAVGAAWDDGKVVASVCHGPAAFSKVKDRNGDSIVKSRQVSAFTDSEERGVGLADAMPFLLESRLRELGADFEGVADWQPFAVADGKLVTGQNPASSEQAAQKVLSLLP